MPGLKRVVAGQSGEPCRVFGLCVNVACRPPHGCAWEVCADYCISAKYAVIENVWRLIPSR